MRPPKHLERSDVLNMLQHRFAGCTVVEMAEHLNISRSYLYDVFKGKVAPGPSILGYLHLQKKINVVYLPVEAVQE